jgi:hypothetical protein
MASVLVPAEAAGHLGAILLAYNRQILVRFLDEADELARLNLSRSAILIAGAALEFFESTPRRACCRHRSAAILPNGVNCEIRSHTRQSHLPWSRLSTWLTVSDGSLPTPAHRENRSTTSVRYRMPCEPSKVNTLTSRRAAMISSNANGMISNWKIVDESSSGRLRPYRVPAGGTGR